MAQSVRSQLLHGVAWNFIEKILIRGASFFIGIILARLLSPSDYGLIGMLAVFISISNVFIEGGLAKALIQRFHSFCSQCGNVASDLSDNVYLCSLDSRFL